jgi:hypothetical protein
MIVREMVLRVNLQSLVIICDCMVVVSITKIDVGSMYESVGTGVKRHRACRELSGSRELLCSREISCTGRNPLMGVGCEGAQIPVRVRRESVRRHNASAKIAIGDARIERTPRSKALV